MGQTKAEEAKATVVLQNVICRIRNRFLKKGNPDRKPNEGCKRAKIHTEDGYKMLTARRH